MPTIIEDLLVNSDIYLQAIVTLAGLGITDPTVVDALTKLSDAALTQGATWLTSDARAQNLNYSEEVSHSNLDGTPVTYQASTDSPSKLVKTNTRPATAIVVNPAPPAPPAP